MAFFLVSVVRAPAIVVVIVFGGMCRRPGPNVRGLFGFADVGNADEEILSPGRTIG